MTDPDPQPALALALALDLDTPQQPQTPAQTLRARQAARIAAGAHPLATDGASLRLHPQAGSQGGPTCGTCAHRGTLGGHARAWPKCLYGATETPIPPERQQRHGPKITITMPRVTHGAATDVRAWWPACTDWTRRDHTP